MYITKSLSNKLYLKKKLYELHMNEETTVLEYLNFFNKLINELLAVDIKIDREDKALIFLSSLLQSYDHIVTTILYGKEALILEVTSTLLSNEIRKKSNQEEQTGSGLVVTERKERGKGKEGLRSSKAYHFCHSEGY